MRAIEATDLVVRYGHRTAVHGLTFGAEAGEALALLGPNGAGKTTTVETLEGYRKQSAGQVRVLGLDPARDMRSLAPLIGVMLQRGGIYPSMSPARALALFASYYDDHEDPGLLIDRLGLSGVTSTPWKQLSGGEQQRLALALALVGRPKVAFLDEPTAGVDPAGRRTIRQVVHDLKREGVCVVLTTHDLEDAERMADRVVIVDRGRALAEGAPAELTRSASGSQILFGARAGLPLTELGRVLAAEVHEAGPGEYRVDAAPTPQRVAALTGWLAKNEIPLRDLRAGRQSLEDVFLGLTERDDAEPDEDRARRDTPRPDRRSPA